MWKSISMFLGGIVAALLVVLKLKSHDVVQVDGDYIEDQKVKNNSKTKNKNGVFGWLKRDPVKKAAKKALQILKHKNKRLN